MYFINKYIFFYKTLIWYFLWSYLRNWNQNGQARRHLPASPLTKRTRFERQHRQKQTPTPSSGNLSSYWGAHWRLEHCISNAWYIPLWMLVEFIVCTVIDYNLYQNTAGVVHISGSVYLTAQLIFVCQLDPSWMVRPIQWVPFCYHSIASSSNVCPAEAHTRGLGCFHACPSHFLHFILFISHPTSFLLWNKGKIYATIATEFLILLWD